MMDKRKDRCVLILVHGTFATAPTDEGSQWWQTQGKARRYLEERLGERWQVETIAFRWSGLNSETARDNAAEVLAKLILDVQAQGIPFHLIGHSHGGSVIWKALAETGSTTLTNLRTITTVATPFIDFRRVSRPWTLIVTAFLLLICFIIQLIGGLHIIDLQSLQMGPVGFSVLFLLSVAGFVVSFWLDFRVLTEAQRRAAVSRHLLKWLGILSPHDEALAVLRMSLFRDRYALVPRVTPMKARVVRGMIPKIAHFVWRQLTFLLTTVINNSVVMIFDEIAKSRITQAIQGNDVLFGRVIGISESPVASVRCPPILAKVSAELIDSANLAASRFLLTARQSLCEAALSGVMLSRLPAGWEQALVHTTYFENKLVLELICLYISRNNKYSKCPVYDRELTAWLNSFQEILYETYLRLSGDGSID